MYAIIKTGGKQYMVSDEMSLRVERVEGDVGTKLSLGDVLLIGGNGIPRIGTPTVAGASVEAQIVRQAKDKKVIVYKKKRRKGYEKRFGHRQLYTELKIVKINA